MLLGWDADTKPLTKQEIQKEMLVVHVSHSLLWEQQVNVVSEQVLLWL